MKPLFIFFLFPILLQAQTTVSYTESTTDIINPERGFYRYAETHSDNYSPLDEATLAGYRNAHQPYSANYNIYSSLVYRIFYLDDFTSSDISATYLTAMQADFDAARAAGVKLIVRFAYTKTIDGSSCSNWICPPYGDASKAWVLTHIQQLKPYFIANKDVIAVFQMGFIGTWGEGYYTDHFGDASQSPYILTESNWDDRTEVLNAYLEAVPSDRMIQVRYPQAKQKAIYGSLAPTTSAATTSTQAHDGSNISRIGHHNDCLLASYTDFGTYNNYGPPSSFADTTNLKPYLANDSKFVANGGETCSIYEPFDNCATDGGIADSELRRMHYSYLNSQYNNDVNNGWIGTCLDDIKKELGYRFVLLNGTYTDVAQTGETISIFIDLKNVGYTAPFNSKNLNFILRNTSTGHILSATLKDDVKFWHFGNHSIDAQICLPRIIPIGDYELLLHIADPDISIQDRSEYSIQLANDNVWEESTGYNNLNHTITIKNDSPHPYCITENHFEFVPNLSIKPIKNQLIITWNNLDLNANNGYFLQRSSDNKTFVNLKWIEGSKDLKHSENYSFTDQNIQENKRYYYRLKEVKKNGNVQFFSSKNAVINSDKNITQELIISPNPAKQNITISILEHFNSETDITIYNTQGKILLQKKITNSNEDININIEALEKGIYFVHLSGNDIYQIGKFIKE